MCASSVQHSSGCLAVGRLAGKEEATYQTAPTKLLSVPLCRRLGFEAEAMHRRCRHLPAAVLMPALLPYRFLSLLYCRLGREAEEMRKRAMDLEQRINALRTSKQAQVGLHTGHFDDA